MKTYRTYRTFRLSTKDQTLLIKVLHPERPDVVVIDRYDDNDEAKIRCYELNQEAFDNLPESLTRYQTAWYATTILSEVERLCRVDGSALENVKVTHGVIPVHSTGSWVLWSDGIFSKGVSEIPSGFGQLSSDAASLISTVLGSDGGFVEGGLISLVGVDKILDKSDIEIGPSRGHYASERVQKWVVQCLNGEKETLYIHTAGYFEGYMFNMYNSIEALNESFPAPSSEGITEFPPDDFDYDSQSGFVSKDF